MAVWRFKCRKRKKLLTANLVQLMARKKEMIMQNQELERLVSPLHTDTPRPGVLLCSDSYMAVGCDLRDTTTLSSILDSKLKLSNCLVLCVAEVSLTYMDVRAADALIKWAARLNDGMGWMSRIGSPGGPFSLTQNRKILPAGTVLPRWRREAPLRAKDVAAFR